MTDAPDRARDLKQAKLWCETCQSWRFTHPCGREDCPAQDRASDEGIAARLQAIAREMREQASAEQTGDAEALAYAGLMRKWADDLTRLRVTVQALEREVARLKGKLETLEL